jgi:hypothetical protein
MAVPAPTITAKPPRINRDKVASDVMIALVQRYAPMSATPNEARTYAKAGYVFADALIAECEAQLPVKK